MKLKCLILTLVLVLLCSCNAKNNEGFNSSQITESGMEMTQDTSSEAQSSTTQDEAQSSQPSSSGASNNTSSSEAPLTKKEMKVNISEYAYAGNDSAVLNEAVKSLGIKISAAKIRGEELSCTLELENKIYKLDSTVNFNSISNMTIKGNGAKLVYTRNVGAFYLNSCKNLTFKDLTVDYDPKVYTQGVVQSVSGSTVKMKVDDGYSNSASWIFDKSKVVYSMLFDSNGNLIEGASHTYAYENIKKEGSNGLTMTLTFGTRDGVRAPQAGDRITLFNWAGAPTFNAMNCAGTKYENITVYQSPGTVVSESSGEGGSTIKNVKVIPGEVISANRKPLMTVLSDVFHFGNVKKGPLIDGCTVSNSADDGVNIQGFFFHVLKVNGNVLTVTPKWDTPLDVGETVEGFKDNGYLSVGKAKITAFKKKNDASLKSKIVAAYKNYDKTLQDDTLVYEITLDKALNVKEGDHITSVDRVGSGGIIRNSTFKNNRARGAVVKGQNIVIENNVFENNTSSAIVAHADIYWCESSFAVNVSIKNNKITGSGSSGNMLKWAENDMLGAIHIGVAHPAGVEGFYSCFENKNIVISDNTIKNTQLYGIFVTNCTGIKISNNTIENALKNGANKLGSLYGLTPKSAIFVGMSKDITSSGNTVSGSNTT